MKHLAIYLLALICTLTMSIDHAAGQLDGNYTIGGASPDYATINDAVADLDLQGVSGPVAFNIRDGVYTEQVLIPLVTGASAINTFTLQSESGDSTAVTLTFNADGSGNNYTLELLGTRHTTIRHMTIETQAATLDMVIDLEGTQNITIEHCILQATASNCNGSDEEALIGANNIPASLNLVVRNNVLRNHCRGVEMAFIQNALVEGNELSGLSDYGISASICDTVVIRENRTTSPIINIFFQNNVLSIYKNSILGRLVFDDSSGDADNPAEVFNNFFFGNMIFETYYCEYLNIHHNSFYCDGNALRFDNTDAHVNVQNNVFHLYNNGRILSSSTPMTQFNSDHNDMYSSGPNFIEIDGVQYADLADWQMNSGQDSNSISVDPGFVSATDLHASNAVLIGAGTAGLGIDTDIDNEMRDPLNPCLGADEFDINTAIGSEESIAPLLLFPNPTYQTLNILDWDGTRGHYIIKDISGREIRSGQHSGGPIDVRFLPAGSYFISFIDSVFSKSASFYKL